MSFNDAFISREKLKGIKDIDTLIASLSFENKLNACILCRLLDDNVSVDVIYTWPIPIEPFRGSEKIHIENVIKECKKHPCVHVHSIGNLALSNIIKRFKSDLPSLNKVWFVPILANNMRYIFLGFADPSLHAVKAVPVVFVEKIFMLLESKAALEAVSIMAAKLNTMERYVKEIGHDIASSVQSTIAKLSNVSDGLIPDEFITVKVREAEIEIMAAYRTADGLGITMEENYQIREFVEYNVIDEVRNSLAHFESEAKERNISLELRGTLGEVKILGDGKAMELAIGHLLSNAIKYSFGNTKITLDNSKDSEYFQLRITNKGMPLPDGDGHLKMWDFGYRSEDAKGKHVNGSGIGLYTVKKITLAHFGHVSCVHDKVTKLTTFSVRLPLANYIKKQRPDLIILEGGIRRG